jgi:hypothetical protein
MKYRIKNWNDFQHYKDRMPPWIKLHSSLLTSEVWVLGDDASRALVVASMLLASRNEANDGTFNGDPDYIKRYAYLNSDPDFKPLIKYGFIELLQDASNVLANCNTEESREEESRGRKENIPSSGNNPDKPKKKFGNEEDHQAARWIFERVQQVNPTAKEPNWDSWANDIRLMREQDRRDHRGICELFGWANKDSFWKANILSPDTLRKQWDKLTAKRGTNGSHVKSFADTDYGSTGAL